jgi:hypothetical protein
MYFLNGHHIVSLERNGIGANITMKIPVMKISGRVVFNVVDFKLVCE